jgi:hypothetical protein
MRGWGGSQCFADFLHASNRILAYLHVIAHLIRARNRWPLLFNDPEVSFIPSSTYVSTKLKDEDLEADAIIGRMVRQPAELTRYQEYVATLQKYNLNDLIREAHDGGSCTSFVHAEVLVLDWLTKNGYINSSRFFNDWRYVGCSKPSCILCQFYFQEHQTGVEFRASHGNLYSCWRFPDVLSSPENVARSDMVDRVLKRVREDAFDIVTRKTRPLSRVYDSNTFTSALAVDERWIQGLSSSIADEDHALLMSQTDDMWSQGLSSNVADGGGYEFQLGQVDSD